jgi:hypothetical protein
MSLNPDNYRDKVSGFEWLPNQKLEIPTIIPTKCRDSAYHKHPCPQSHPE